MELQMRKLQRLKFKVLLIVLADLIWEINEHTLTRTIHINVFRGNSLKYEYSIRNLRDKSTHCSIHVIEVLLHSAKLVGRN